MSFGCLINENLHPTGIEIRDTTKETSRAKSSPVTDSLGPQQDSIVKVIIRSGPIAKGLSSVEYERDIKTQLFLTAQKPEERDEVVYERFRHIFRANEVKSCQHKKV